MVWKLALHYARVWLVLALASGQLVAQQKEEILELHNRYRAMVSPEAADMLHMAWNESLSVVAQGYASQCIWEHNHDVMETLGENLFMSTGPLIISKSMATWFDEHLQYDYASASCNLDMCGHYTQMVWAKSSGVGCASHFCKLVEKSDYENATILVCNYFPQGNIGGLKPYEAGRPCSRCPQEASECVENTCAAQMKGTTEEWIIDTWSTDAPQTEPAGSARSTTCSAAMLLLSGLMVSFTF